jgi:hypothetical protein
MRIAVIYFAPSRFTVFMPMNVEAMQRMAKLASMKPIHPPVPPTQTKECRKYRKRPEPTFWGRRLTMRFETLRIMAQD